jgi:hypothetical protein
MPTRKKELDVSEVPNLKIPAPNAVGSLTEGAQQVVSTVFRPSAVRAGVTLAVYLKVRVT